ncbi:IclR family transcriptional regulator [Acrocarpospora corrugata]|uniref:IclR family transcriptional regulator n=1 Tax=Acrocarpospora corrugata TaxID=35763 RepID=A0A5M3VWT7_9ACTN|nr:IclR family transcriptional regulator [Acrocarpospora corrugata]GES00894.1 IclR family transcriptional regulator [Acrocarpospora corrugata]
MASHLEETKPAKEGLDIPSGDIQVVARVVQLLRLLGEAGSIDLVSAAQELQVGKSTAHRYLASMENHGLLQRRSRNRYEFGTLLAELGTMALSRLGVVNLARPVMEQVSLRVRHTVVLSIWNGRCPVVAQVHEDSSRTAHVVIRVGSTLRAGTAQDCVFRAFQDESFHRHYRERPADLAQDPVGGLEEVRRSGVAIRSSSSEGVRAVAVPVRDAGGMVVATLAVVGVTSLVPEEDDSDVVMVLRDGARAITQALRASLEVAGD